MNGEPSCRVYLIRHGETANVGQICFNGHFDVGLSPGGMEQFRRVEVTRTSDGFVHLSGNVPNWSTHAELLQILRDLFGTRRADELGSQVGIRAAFDSIDQVDLGAEATGQSNN